MLEMINVWDLLTI